MTAPARSGPGTPPRAAIRVAWLLHRAVLRVSDGHVGLAQPAAGRRFGMLRLHTVGRRSGQARTAVVGYFEDEDRLVTLAMNGWGRTEPGWWLNLRESPEATVDLPGGDARSVRARAAVGPERDRLWALFGDYPGWGSDIDALATGRPVDTTVVVLEPRPGPGEARS